MRGNVIIKKTSRAPQKFTNKHFEPNKKENILHDGTQDQMLKTGEMSCR